MKRMFKTVVFFGSGPVAATSLRALMTGFKVEAVVTKPTTMKEMTAIAKDVPVSAVRNKKELNKLIASKPFKSRLAVLIDFGIIVEQQIIDYFPLGIVNSHFSLLPEWRGADPITFAILSGQEKTGVSLMLIAEKLDEGPLLAQGVLRIESGETTPQLTDRLTELSNKMLEEILPSYVEGKIIPYEQPVDEQPTYSRKLKKIDGIIDWKKPAVQIEREIRAFIEWPKSRTKLAGKDVIITKSSVAPHEGSPGDVMVMDKKIVVFCGTDALVIDNLKPAGKREMTAQEFLAGYGNQL